MDHRVQKAIALAEQYLQEGWSSAKLAELVNLSTSRLHQLFKEETGMPPAKYLRQLRMQRARHLLETTNLSVKQVMVAVGVSDESHFVRDFKKACGLTPARYREQFLSSRPEGAEWDLQGRPGASAPPGSMADSPAPPSSVSPSAPPLLVRRASHPQQLSAGVADRTRLRGDGGRRELVSLLSERHAAFAEVTTVITDNIVRGMTDERGVSYPQRRGTPERPRPPHPDFPHVSRARSPRSPSPPALPSASAGRRKA